MAEVKRRLFVEVLVKNLAQKKQDFSLLENTAALGAVTAFIVFGFFAVHTSGIISPKIAFASDEISFAPRINDPDPNIPLDEDVNNDGNLDLYAVDDSTNTLSILLGNGDGTFEDPIEYVLTYAPTGMVLSVDLNDDNNADLVIGNNDDNLVTILLGNGDGTFDAEIHHLFDNVLFDSIIIEDLNDDTFLDLAVRGFDDPDFVINISLGNGDGTFDPAVSYSVSSSAVFNSGLQADDLNNDDALDLFVPYGYDSAFDILLGNGDGTFDPAVSYVTGLFFEEPVVLGDFDNDNFLDISFVSLYTSELVIYFNDGDGIFVLGAAYTTGTNPIGQAETTADFDGDDSLDLVVTDYGDETISVFLNNGDGTFAAAAPYATGGGPSMPIVADLNDDGDYDIAVSNFDDHNVSVFLGNGDGTFDAAINFGTYIQPGFMLPAVDINNDDLLDLFVPAGTSPSFISILINNTGAPVGTWDSVGDPNFTDMSYAHISLNFDSNNVPYIASNVLDMDTGEVDPYVMMYDGDSWEYVGPADLGFHDYALVDFVVGSDNTLYVLVGNNAGSPHLLSVLMYDGDSWEPVGAAGFTLGSADGLWLDLAFDPNDVPYVIYRDTVTLDINVQMYDGDSWELVGPQNLVGASATWPGIAFDSNAVPYINYTLSNGRASVRMWDGDSWELVGDPSFTFTTAIQSVLAIDDDDTLYLAHTGNVLNGEVMTFDGDEWVAVGSRSITPTRPFDMSFALDNDGMPHFAYVNDDDHATVMAFNGDTWQLLGIEGFSDVIYGFAYQSMENINLAFDNNNVPHLAYVGYDGVITLSANVVSYTPPVPPPPADEEPTVTTVAASAVTETTATLNGNITDIGSDTPTERGFEYGLDGTYGTEVSETGTYSTGAFSLGVTGLTCNTLYHFRAFATSADGTGNGSDLTFTTAACPVTPPPGGGGSGSVIPPTIPVTPVFEPLLPIVPIAVPVTTPANPTDSDEPTDPTDGGDPDETDDSGPPIITENPSDVPPQDGNSGPVNTDPNSSSSPWSTIQTLGYHQSSGLFIVLSPASSILFTSLLPLVAGLMPLIGFVSLGSLGLSGLILLFSRYWLDLLSFFGLRRKRRIWGTVYDSSTKQPLDPAIVELIDTYTGQVVEQAITDLAGRYGFLATKGEFTLRATKTHFVFPSTKESGSTDEIFDNLYHGEKLSLVEGSTLVVPNIPMDPVAYDWNQEAKQKLLPARLRLEYIVQFVFTAIFITGFVFAIYNFFTFSSLWNSVLLGLYVAVSMLRLILKPKHLWGRLMRDGHPVAGVTLELTEKQLGVVLGRSRSAVDGKFFLKAPAAGEYRLWIKTASQQVLWSGDVRVGKDNVFNSDIALPA